MSKTDLPEQRPCEVCLEPLEASIEAGQLSGCWAAEDGKPPERYKVLLCKGCLLRVLSGLSRDRMLTGLFSEEPDGFIREGFGSVTD